MNNNLTLGLWKSHYSIGKSILSLEKKGSSITTGPTSIIDLVAADGWDKAVLVEDSFSGFLEAYKNFKEIKVQLIFGIRLTFVPDAADKSPESLNKEHKMIIFAKNKDGYQKLIKIYSKAATDGFYYIPRLDYKTLKSFWDDKNLTLAHPFYDSFLFQNALTSSLCVPDINFTAPVFFYEDNNLPFDYLVQNRVKEYTKGKYEVQKAQSIYYAKKEDFLSYCVFRCINKRTTLNKPNLDGFTSNEFCYEKWKESWMAN